MVCHVQIIWAIVCNYVFDKSSFAFIATYAYIAISELVSFVLYEKFALKNKWYLFMM